MTTRIKIVGVIKTPLHMTVGEANRLVDWLNDQLLTESPVELDWANIIVDEVEDE